MRDKYKYNVMEGKANCGGYTSTNTIYVKCFNMCKTKQ